MLELPASIPFGRTKEPMINNSSQSICSSFVVQNDCSRSSHKVTRVPRGGTCAQTLSYTGKACFDEKPQVLVRSTQLQEQQEWKRRKSKSHTQSLRGPLVGPARMSNTAFSDILKRSRNLTGSTADLNHITEANEITETLLRANGYKSF